MADLPDGFVSSATEKLNTSRLLAGCIAAMGAKTYIGNKVIHAAPMTHAEYNQLRGWELPTDGNGNDPGYIVQYADQDHTNLAGFTGYIS
ncbi:hypothetical protein ACJRO0_14275 [Acetobacter oryzifermentans]|uniref:hypothetical protein n=1 Tax=Acetobacter oryzifermentans TaxID=1633874 RepID=UPI0039BF9FF6